MRLSTINVIDIHDGAILSVDSFNLDSRKEAEKLFADKLKDKLDNADINSFLTRKGINDIVKRATKACHYKNQWGDTLDLVISFA